ncbi:MAG: alpha/beta fold hydrolase [Chitinophagaceae bacterium]
MLRPLLWVYICCVFCFSSCFTFRMEERKMLRKLNRAGVEAGSVMVTFGTDDRIHYTTTGADTLPTLVILHGSPGGSREYLPYLRSPALRKKFRVVAVDRPGFGLSNFGTSYPLQEQSHLLGPVLYALHNGKPLFVAGHSLGGPVAAILAADYPELVDGLVIMSGALDPALEKKEPWRPLLNREPLRSLLPGAFPQSNIELWYLKNDLKSLSEKLNRIRARVYILHGATDKMVPPENVAYMKKYFVNAQSIQVTMMPATGHLLHLTRVKKVTEFLLAVE